MPRSISIDVGSFMLFSSGGRLVPNLVSLLFIQVNNVFGGHYINSILLLHKGDFSGKRDIERQLPFLGAWSF